jgi:FkbM family methyltransferase
MLTTLKRIVKKVVYSIVPPPHVPVSYSQAGEDAVLRFLFLDRHMRQISYLDIGANVPDSGNNTYLFYRTGSRGVCVEADRTLIPRFEKLRPGDTILNVGVSTVGDDAADFYVFDASGMNTFDKDEAVKRAASGYKLTDTVKVRLVDINTVIRTNFERYPDLLSIDIEGLDLAVLKTLDFESYLRSQGVVLRQ